MMAAAKKKDSTSRHKPRKMVPIPLELYEEAAELAAKGGRPVTWEIRMAIREHIDRTRATK